MNGTSTACRPARPRHYHKSGSPWVECLRVLWRKGWSASRIARTLSRLSAPACREWLADGSGDDLLLDSLERDGASLLSWTVQQVRYWTQFRGSRPGRRRWRRRQPGPVRYPKRPSRPRHPDERPLDARRAYARDRGWLHLLPAADGEAGLELTRRDADVLCALRDHGPMTRAQVADLLQLRGSARRLLRRSGESVLGRLRRAGLVEVLDHAGGRWNNRAVYALTGKARQPRVVETAGIFEP